MERRKTEIALKKAEKKPPISLTQEKQTLKKIPKKVTNRTRSYKEKKVIIKKEKKSVKKPLSFFSKIKHLIRKSSKK